MGSSNILITNLCKTFNKLCIQNINYASRKNVLRSNHLVQNTFQHTLVSWRFSNSFVSRLTGEQLWKGCTSVSPAGRRKGRGRTTKKIKDLNRGQIIGCGKINMLWPGLNAPIIQGREVLRQQLLPPDEDREKRLLEIRNKLGVRKRLKIHPLERGWSGTKLHGRSLGPPDPIGDETFEGFNSICLQLRTVCHMTGQRGRVRTFFSMAVVGNKNGLAGFAYAKSGIGLVAAKCAKNKAAKLLRWIPRDNNTVLHDFFCEFGANRIFVERRPEGYGLNCHRAIKAICQVVGIKDLYAKAEGPTRNTLNLTRAFFIGLMSQKTLKQIADEKQLHLVKLQANRDHFPLVVASPDKCRTEKEIPPTEVLDFDYHIHNGKTVEERKKFQPFYINFPSYIKRKKELEKLRNHRDVRIHLLAKYGDLKSFVQIREEEKAKKETINMIEEST